MSQKKRPSTLVWVLIGLSVLLVCCVLAVVTVILVYPSILDGLTAQEEPPALLPFPFKRQVNYQIAAWGIFTDPELAHAGLTEEEARSLYGEKISVYRQRFQNIDRGKTDGAEMGISKFICDPKGKLLGAHVFGKRACEIIHEAQLVKALNLPLSKIQSVIHVYPSYSDVIKQPAKQAYIESLRKNPFISLLQRTIVKK